jgi:farnesyl diphosphate synthase
MAREPATDDPAIQGRKLRVIGVIATAAGATGMVGGQALDLAGALATSASAADDLRIMHSKKTGALIRGAAVAGAIMGGADASTIAKIDSAAGDLGLAFQIVDDILDVEGVPAAIGKTTGKDAAAGKPTYPALYGLDGARRLASECLERAEATLRDAGLAGSHLMAIGRWIVERRH